MLYIQFKLPASEFKKMLLCRCNGFWSGLTHAFDLNDVIVVIDGGKAALAESGGKNSACGMYQFTLMRFWCDIDSNARFFCYSSDLLCITLLRRGWKVECQCYVASIGINAAAVKIIGISQVLGNHFL